IFSALFYLTVRRGATDPVCGMKVDRKSAYVSERDGQTVYFCSAHCQARFEAEPSRYLGPAPHERKVAAELR
ncbi:MAG: P-type Cu+ transporter, partial [Solirubrobacteraceae bacterium]|nr:P-type Cu+ transporter [Solirubrobacteraceae bacterium]